MVHGPSAASCLLQALRSWHPVCVAYAAADSLQQLHPQAAARFAGPPDSLCDQAQTAAVGALLAGQLDAEVLGYPYSVSDGLSLSVLETPQGFPNRSWRATLQERAWRRPQKQHVFHPGHA